MAQKARPPKSSIPIAEATPPEDVSGGASVPITVDTDRLPQEGEALYWFGALPALGKVKFWMSPAEGQAPNPERDDERVEVEMTALEAWFPRNKRQPRLWLGRCRYYQNLGVSGLEFPAYSEERVREAANESQSFMLSWPGKVARISDGDLRSILTSVRNHALRPKTDSAAEIVNYLHGHMRGCKGPRECTCSEIERGLPPVETQRRIAGISPERILPKDLPMADFVYLQRLNADVDYPEETYYRLVPSMEQFLGNPPQSLSADHTQLDPQEEAAAAQA